jgi:hypothetical protein
MYSYTHSLTSALDRGEWSASRPGRFNPRERSPSTRWIWGWMGPRAVLDALVKRKIPRPHRESNPRTPIIHPVAQRYTDWAITPKNNAYLIILYNCYSFPLNKLYACSDLMTTLECFSYICVSPWFRLKSKFLGTSRCPFSLCLTKHSMKTYWGSGGTAPRILGLGTRWRWVVSFTLRPLYPQGKCPWYTSDRRQGGPQNRSGHGSEEKNSQPPPGIET